MKLVTADQMRRVEDRSERLGVSKDALMENAGLAAARRVRGLRAPLFGVPAVALVGPGNNGGDGLVVARHLRRWGASVAAYICAGRRAPDAKLDAAADAGVAVVRAHDDPGLTRLRALLGAAHIVVDAVFGIGRLRPLDGAVADALALLADGGAVNPDALIVALDVPSGMDADTGAALPETPYADLTLAMGHLKPCHINYDAQDRLGAVETLDIDLPPGADDDAPVSVMTADRMRVMLPRRPLAAHKGSFGKALIAAGSRSYIGAAYLAAIAAARAGAGLVALALPDGIRDAVAAKAAEPIFLPLPTDADGDLRHDAADVALDALPSYSAMLLGCGMGQSPGARRFIESVLRSGAALPPCVIDADGLNALAATPEWWERFPDVAVLTPHPGEMARLSGASTAETQADRVGTALRCAALWNKIVVLKGAYTIVAHPDGTAMLSPFANPALATAGTGDALAGCIAGLLSQGAAPRDAAALGVYIHAVAGEAVRGRLGDAGMIASDLLPELPLAMNALRCGAYR